jgi:hypothetical protein
VRLLLEGPCGGDAIRCPPLSHRSGIRAVASIVKPPILAGTDAMERLTILTGCVQYYLIVMDKDPVPPLGTGGKDLRDSQV